MFQSLVDMLFPPSGDALLVREAENDELIKEMSVRRFQKIEYLLPFRDPLVRAAVHEAKFFGNKKATALLGYVLAVHLSDIAEGTILIPVPLSKKRQRERGYNQAEQIARAANTRCIIRTDVVVRSMHTVPQTGLRRDERLANLDRVFSIAKPDVLYGKHVILLDDVTTTGTTIEKVRAVVELCGPAEIRCVAMAH